MNRIHSQFYSHDTLCDGELILPDNIQTKPPVVLMAHGFGFLRYFGLMRFARVLLDRGIAVFIFDYRSFGFSQGEPRQLIDPISYRDDFDAALKHVESLTEIDTSRIGIFGCSFSSGPVFEVASGDKSVKAVSSIVPYMSTSEFLKKRSFIYFLIRAIIGYFDVFRGKMGFRPFYVPISVPPKALKGLIGVDENKPDYPGVKIVCSVDGVKLGTEIVSVEVENKSDGSKTKWENKVPARSFVKMYYYHPYEILERVMCPVQIIAGTKDTISPFESVSLWRKNLKFSELISFEGGHFDPYKIGIFENISKKQAEFFERNFFTN